MKTTLLLVAAGLLFVPRTADAQQLKLLLRDGRVSLEAQNVPVRQILGEWARVGGVTIVNADKVTGPPVTLHLVDTPESQALEVILRSVAGYMLAPRQPERHGVSVYDRILILAVSAAPKNQPVVPPPPVINRIPPAPMVDPGDDSDDNDGRVAPVRRPPFGNAPVTLRPPVVPMPGTEPEDEPAAGPSPIAPPASQANPFGVPTGSGRPGAITPVPQQGQEPARR